MIQSPAFRTLAEGDTHATVRRRVKADSHVPCRSAKALDCIFLIWFTQRGRVWFTHTRPFPCHATNMPFWKRPLKAMAGSRQGDGLGTAWYVWISIGLQRRHVGDLPAFGLFLLPRGVPKSLSEAYQSQMQVASVKRSNVCDGREEAYFGARTWALV
jgi:hypothetical protein